MWNNVFNKYFLLFTKWIDVQIMITKTTLI